MQALSFSWEGGMELEAASKALFGQKHRLRVVATVASWPRAEMLLARGVADASGVRENQVGPVLRDLARIGLLVQETDALGGGQRIWYTRSEALFWGAMSEIVERVQEEAAETSEHGR